MMGDKSCSVCKMDFKTPKLYRTHLETKRHTDREKAETKMYLCECCGKSYTQRQNMYRHRKSCKPQITTVCLDDRIKILEKQIKDLILSHAQKEETPPMNNNYKRRKISKHVRQHIVDNQNNCCGKCKKEFTPYFQIDHIIGLQFGGTDDESNLMALCCECHAMKSIAENQCRKEIQDAIQTILSEHKQR